RSCVSSEFPSLDCPSPVLDRLFHLSDRRTSVAAEARAGTVTFLTMAYILLVNPQVLAQAGLPAADVAVATALSAALATLLMGLWANYPFALAPGMGLNAYFTFGVVLGMGVPWQTALAAVFVEGVLFLLLSLGGIRALIVSAIPGPIKIATTAGIGLFLALIGFQNAGLVVANPAPLVGRGVVRSAPVLLALGGLVLVAALMARGVPGALLVGIGEVTAVVWAAGLAALPDAWLTLLALPTETFLALDLSAVFTLELLPVVLAFLFVDLFDTAG